MASTGIAPGKPSRPNAGAATDGQDGSRADLSEAAHPDPAPRAQGLQYLLRGLTVDRPNQVWCADIRYIPMRRGFLYLVAVMDWATGKVLSWRLSNSMDADFCILALEEALARYGPSEIFNTDQGSQFASPRFVDVLKDAGVRVSMDGRGRWMDNVFIKRLWRSLKYECVYIHAFETGSELRDGLTWWINYYNTNRPHSALPGHPPPTRLMGKSRRRPIRGSPRRGLTPSADSRRNLNLSRP